MKKHFYGDIFFDDIEKYDRPDTFQEEYVKSIEAMLLREYKGLTKEQIKPFVQSYIQERTNPVEVDLYIKNTKTEDREPVTMPIDAYLELANATDSTISPSLTCYTKDIVPVDGKYMEYNKEKRAIIKEQASDALGEKRYDDFATLNASQKTKKIKNNAYTGGASLLHLPYASHTHHYTFTSVTSMMTGNANTIAERFMGGNRIYYDLQSVIDEINLIVNNMDLAEWEDFKKLNVHIPTIKEVIQIIKHSTSLYFELPVSVIKRYLKTFSDIELMAIAYTGDFFHFDKYNPTFSADFLAKAIEKVVSKSLDDFDLELLNSQDTTEMTHLHKIFADELTGIKLGYEQHAGTTLGSSLTVTLKHFRKVINEFAPILKPICNVNFLYVNVQRSKEAIHKVVPLSDTDSSTPIAHYWTLRSMYITSKSLYTSFTNGNRNPDMAKLYAIEQKKASPMASLFSMLTSYQTKHHLRMFASNMNVTRNKWDTLEMKPEFLFDVFAPLSISKHYAKLTSIKECFVYEDKMKEIEVSGVGLIANNASDRTLNKQHELLHYIKDSALNKTVAYEDVLNKIYEYEESTIAIANGKQIIEDGKKIDINELLSLVRVNSKDEYAKPLASLFFARMLYEPLAEKYGSGGLDDTTYGYTLPLTLSKRVDIVNWLSTLEPKLAKSFEKIIFKEGKKKAIGRIFIPKEAFELHGVPTEILPILDTTKLTAQAFKPVHTASLLLGVAVDELTGLPLCTSHGIHVPDEYLKQSL